jgi:hypothetical protein
VKLLKIDFDEIQKAMEKTITEWLESIGIKPEQRHYA